MNSSGTLKIARNGYIVMAVVFCALGIFLMAVPEKAVKIICVLAGILFIADGIIKIIGYFSRDFYWRGIFAGGNTEALCGSIHCENP